MTNARAYTPNATSIAAFLLSALDTRDELVLERCLGRARSTLSGLRPNSPAEVERVELLVGIVERLGGPRQAGDQDDAYTAFAVCQPLLENLVGMTQQS
jgi:hypothetical protein